MRTPPTSEEPFQSGSLCYNASRAPRTNGGRPARPAPTGVTNFPPRGAEIIARGVTRSSVNTARGGGGGGGGVRRRRGPRSL